VLLDKIQLHLSDLFLLSLLTDAMEDPITFIKGAGYISVEDTSAYSYVYDGLMGTLDYIFVNPNLASKMIKAAVWHANEDEPDVLGELSIMR
jgi:predicted extracellular nuclease